LTPFTRGNSHRIKVLLPGEKYARCAFYTNCFRQRISPGEGRFFADFDDRTFTRSWHENIAAEPRHFAGCVQLDAGTKTGKCQKGMYPFAATTHRKRPRHGMHFFFRRANGGAAATL